MTIGGIKLEDVQHFSHRESVVLCRLPASQQRARRMWSV